jgi:hypothetical protein
MAELPHSYYLANQENISLPKGNLQHICIDQDPLAELCLRLDLVRNNISLSEIPNIYGFKYVFMGKTEFYFLSEEQVQAFQLKINCKE